jgi:molybdopterin adenylyltransferase
MTEVVPDEAQAIVAAFQRNGQADFILTTGGTGISPRDVTPEATSNYCDRELPGIAEILRAESYKETPTAVLSRGYAGIKGNTIIVNFPGSVKAVRLCTQVLIPVMEHALSMLHGEGH